jgi:hypothetical protein
VISLRQFKELTILLGLSLLLAACGKEKRNDYCKNHYLFHADHKSTLGKFVVSLDDGGLMTSRLTIPAEIYQNAPVSAEQKLEQLALILQQNQAAYSLETETVCEQGKATVEVSQEGLSAWFESSCGESNRLKQVNVTLLDLIPELEEIEVEVTTQATFKRFAISRQCESAIFRLEQQVEINE